MSHDRFLPEDALKEASNGLLYVHGGFSIWGVGPVNEERAKRKLTAILSADIKGHNHLMEKGKLATVHTLETYQEIVTEAIKCYYGRIVDYPRDNMLTEFLSVMDEVKSDVKIKWNLLSVS